MQTRLLNLFKISTRIYQPTNWYSNTYTKLQICFEKAAQAIAGSLEATV
jgi:hypothetical protein